MGEQQWVVLPSGTHINVAALVMVEAPDQHGLVRAHLAAGTYVDLHGLDGVFLRTYVARSAVYVQPVRSLDKEGNLLPGSEEAPDPPGPPQTDVRPVT